ncbi:MAG: DUF3857 domain-containing protein [Polyangiaceae bacterium]
MLLARTRRLDVVRRSPWRSFRIAVMYVLVLGALIVPARRVTAAPPADELTRLTNAALSATGPSAYAALRELFAQWSVSDPGAVEAALEAFADSPKTSPAGRAYAQTLLASARARRGDSAGARAKMASLGFVHDWLFVGPFDDENRVGLPAQYQPESEFAMPIVPGRAYDGKERPVRWRATPPDVASAVLDLGDWLRPREKMCAYAATVLRAADGTKAPRKIALFIGVEGSFKMFFNGVKVSEDARYRGFDFDRSAAVVELKPGANRLTVKVCNDVAAPRLSVRVADEKGAPDLGVVSTNDPAATEASGANVVKDDPSAKPGKPASKAAPLAPIDAFDAAVAGDKPSAASMDAYARYLVTTGGNPMGEHQARDLATRAAEAEPTWERALFAANLVEDRNQARRWVDRAAELAPAHDARAEVAILLAEAQLARTSANWRDATPFYEKALAVDPDNLLATLGRTELYVRAGLPRTALAVLEKAVERHPSSSALLGVYAAQLRDLGRDAEAADVEASWFAYNADDSSFIQRQVDRAASRGDSAATERWLNRLEAAEPNVVFSLTVAARAYRSLGMRAQARSALERALEIAPEDASTMRTLADLAGEAGERDTQLRYLRRVLLFYPQSKDVRTYVDFLSPAKPRQDESYAWDKDAIAAAAAKPAPKNARSRILRRLLVTTVFENGLASRFYQIVFQPLTDEAAAAARQYITQYEADRQEIELRLSRVYRQDGTIAEAAESGEAAANDPSIAMYTSVRAFFVTFPRISAGDVVELRYRVDDVTARNEVADAFYDVEYLQESEPIGESEYLVLTPKSRELKTFVANLPGVTPEVTETGDQRVYRFLAKDVPALTPEPGQPPSAEVLGQVHVSTFKTWDEIGKWYWGLAKDQLDVDDAVRTKLKEIAGSATDEASKVRAVYHYVTNLRYVALEFGLEGIKPRRCALTLARGWGDCKDKATVIVTMLRELGIKANLVLVRTGLRGDLPAGAPPSLGVFDHAIAYVPSMDLYLDGTAEGSGSTELPEMDRDSVALRINEDGTANLVHLPNPGAEASPHTRAIDVALASDGSASFTYDFTAAGVTAPGRRARYRTEGTRQARASEDMPAFFGPVQVEASGITVRDADDVEKPFSITVKGKAPQFARKEGDTLSIPVATPIRLRSSAASLSTRKVDLVLGAPTTLTETRVIKLPAGAKIETAIEPTSVTTPFGTVEVQVKTEAGKVTVTSRFSILKSRVTPAEYAAFRDFCEKVDAALEQRLVVKP